MQQKVFDIIHSHTFGSSGAEQLMVVIGTARMGKSYRINAIQRLHASGQRCVLRGGVEPANVGAARHHGARAHTGTMDPR
jgi:hypothetical protein